MVNETGFYIDHKGRRRWHCNDALAVKLKELHAFLVIGDYDEVHAARYPRLAHSISRHPESVAKLKEDGRLQEIAGVSTIISTIISEILETGTCRKMTEGDEYFSPPPLSVLELTAIPRLGAKRAKMLYRRYGIDSLKSLQRSVDDGSLEQIKGFGKGMIAAIREHIRQTPG